MAHADAGGTGNILSLQIAGRGRVSPDYNGTPLTVGQTYKVVAYSARGSVFSNWVGWAEGTEVLRTNIRTLSFVMQSNFTLRATFADVARPVVKITTPRRGQRWSNDVFTIQGTARDNDQVTAVFCRVNDGFWQAVTTTNGWSNWTAQVTLSPGTNSVQAYAVDTAGHASRTNTARVTYVKLYTLTDYYPLREGARWVYSGTDWDGAAATITQEITSTNFTITNFYARTQPVAYPTNCVLISSAYVDPVFLSPYDTWEEFVAVGPRFGWFGDDDFPKESLRVARGLVLPEKMPVRGVAVTRSTAYMLGKYVGRVSLRARVLEQGPLTVAAGTFPDVLHLRISISTAGGTQVHDEWWARSVGKIKRQGISGSGRAQAYELTGWSIP